ncbi:MAG TPA: proline dehydrogenase family protein [Trebonia sp.]
MLRKALLATAASERVRETVTRTPATRAIVNRYVAGESSEDAVAVARVLRSDGLLVTLDYLGEDTTDAQRAAATAAQYVHLLGKLAAEGLTEAGAVEVSVKPTAVGLLLGSDSPSGPNELGIRIATEHLERIAAAARDAGTTVTIDAEDHRTTGAGLRIANELRSRFRGQDPGLVGTVLQAALRRTETDLRELAAPGVRVRLCKGAYAEPASEAFPARHDIDRSYARCLRILMGGAGYPMIATHDPRLVAITRSLGLGRPADSFEYQMLYGVRPQEQRYLAGTGARVRVYVPYGGDWYPYLVRRLAERPSNLALFLRSLGSRS